MANPQIELAQEMASLCIDFLESLDDDQRERALWTFPSTDERHLWFYTPTDHGGVTLGSLRPMQQRKALQFVASGLSTAGYVTVSTIMGLENVLDQVEGWGIDWGRERGRDPGLYYLRIFGNPEKDSTWSWRFGGHHVSIQHTIVDGGVISSTPCFLGADPASSPLLGAHLLRPLAAAEDIARDIVQSLSQTQLHRALLSPVAPADIVATNRVEIQEGERPLDLKYIFRNIFEGELLEKIETMQQNADQTLGIQEEHLEAVSYSANPKGVSVKDLDPNQKDAIRSLLDTYLQRVPDSLAEIESAKYQGNMIDELSFAWAGSIEPGKPHYYRIQAAELLVEYDNTQRSVNHVHTVWRNPKNDFGGDVLAEHLQHHH